MGERRTVVYLSCMVHTSVVRSSLRFVVLDLVGDFITWPLWWYTAGVRGVLDFLIRQVRTEVSRLNLRVWLANLFEPMFGQSDWQGRAISVVMRLVVLGFRVIVLAVWLIGLSLLLLLWLLLPLAALYQIAVNLWGIPQWVEPIDLTL